MISFGYGTSRFVICIGPWAIKVARIRIVHWIIRITQKVLVADASFYTGSAIHVGKNIGRLKHLLSGIVANSEEVRFNTSHPDLPLAPTIFSVLGFINIQRRGKPIRPDELSQCPFREICGVDIDLRKVEHFGRVDGRIVLIDYGSPELNAIIELNYAHTSVVCAT